MSGSILTYQQLAFIKREKPGNSTVNRSVEIKRFTLSPKPNPNMPDIFYHHDRSNENGVFNPENDE